MFRSVAYLIFLLIFPGVLHGENSFPFASAPKIIASSHFGLAEGLPTNCLEEAFMDSKGRLWINACKNISNDLSIDFFQYDGTQSIFYELSPVGLDSGRTTPLSIIGETVDGLLFGTDHSYSLVFYWHPDLEEQYFLPIEEGLELLNIVPASTGGVLLLTREEQMYHISHIQDGHLSQIGEIKLEHTDHHYFYFRCPLVVNGDKAWFFHQRMGIVEANLETGDMEFKRWNSFRGGSNIGPGRNDSQYGYLRWNMFEKDNEHLVLYLGQSNGFFEFDPINAQISEFEFLNEQLQVDEENMQLMIFHNEDRRGNHFLVSAFMDSMNIIIPDAETSAVLLERSGEWSDYSDIMDQMGGWSEFGAYNNRLKYFGLDFRQQMGWASSEGLTMLDLRADLKISTYPTHVGIRAIRQIDQHHLLANTDTENIKLNLESRDHHLVQSEGFLVEYLTPFIDEINGKILMAAEEKGLVSYDISNQSFELLKLSANFTKFDLISENLLVFITHAGALYFHDLNEEVTNPFMYQGKVLNIHSQANELLVLEDSTVWIGAQNGLWRINLTNGEVTNYPINSADPRNILCIHEGEDGVLWLGSSRSGIFLFDANTGASRQVSEVHGLSNNTVAGILNDEHGNRWVSTFRGITVLSSQGEVMFEVQPENGLVNLEFNRTSYATLPDGRLAFGGTKGIDILDPEEILGTIGERNPVQIYLTHLEFFDFDKGENVVLQGDVRMQPHIDIPSTHRYISLDFAMSQYVDMSEHQYVYRVIPDNTSELEANAFPWTDLGSLSQLSISNLSAGYYIVQIRGIDQKGSITAQTLEIPVHVNKFFYKRWWFYSIITLPFFIFALIWIRRIKGEQHRLEKEVKRRTEQVQRDKVIIEEQAVELQRLDQAKTRFFTNISHEFRTPLTVILGMAAQIRNQTREKKLIQRNAKQLLNLINQILDLGKLEAGNISAKYVKGNVITFFKYFIESFNSLAEQKNVQLDFETTENSLVLDYDPEKLNHIVSNLLTNAIKFTPEGGKVRFSVEVHRNVTPPLFQFSVTDTGIGIPQNKLPYIFDRFFHMEDELEHGESGVGIGLSLVQELVKLLKGSISVNSIPGTGTTFTVMLPYTNHAKAEYSLQESFPEDELTSDFFENGSFPSGNSGKDDLLSLLIVEDNRDVTEYLTDCLEDEYQLLFAVDGQEGLEMTLKEMPDIIISDVMMPRLDGLSMCKEIKNDERTSHIPVIMLTAKADVHSRIEGLEYGADVYLAKPFHKRELQVQLRNLVLIRSRLHERYANLENLQDTLDKSTKKEDTFVLGLRETILESIDEEEFGVPELCRKIGMSRTQLHNKIKALTDLSTSKFIRKIRIDQAAQLLRTTDMSISQVAFEVGVESLTYFTKIFTEEIGLPPSKYRRKKYLEQ